MRKSVKQGRGSAIIQHLPHFYQSGDYENLLHGFVEIFGRILDTAEEDLIRVMRAHWVNTANNEDSQGFDSKQKGDLDKIFALFLENLGGTAQLRQIDRRDGEEGDADDAAYRTRIKGLIAVLLRGASTREGIRAVVGANLGIFGDSMNTPEMRQKIQIIEFLAGSGAATEDHFTPLISLPLFGGFTVNNSDNPVASSMQLVLQVADPTDLLATKNWQLVNLCVWNSRNNRPWATYGGPLKKGDRIAFMPDGSIVLGSTVVQTRDRFDPLPEGQMVPFQVFADFQTINPADKPRLLQGGRFHFAAEAEAGLTPPHFVGPLLAVPSAESPGTVFFPNVNMFEEQHSLLLLQPATFQVRIYWDIPPYTDVFDQRPGDNTRSLIHLIVDKVKAAGVYSEVNFVKNFTEEHDLAEQLHWGIGHLEEQDNREGDITIGDFKKLYGNGLAHEMEANFSVFGVFNHALFREPYSFA